MAKSLYEHQPKAMSTERRGCSPVQFAHERGRGSAGPNPASYSEMGRTKGSSGSAVPLLFIRKTARCHACKTLMLCAALYLGGALTSLVAVNLPGLDGQIHLSASLDTKSEARRGVFGQVVNRSRKADRIPVQHASPNAKEKINVNSPTAATPGVERDIKCALPDADIAGRCFARATRGGAKGDI